MILGIAVPLFIWYMSCATALRFAAPVMRNYVPFTPNPKRALRNLTIATFFFTWATWIVVNAALLAAIYAPAWAIMLISGEVTWPPSLFMALLTMLIVAQGLFVFPVFFVVSMVVYFSQRIKVVQRAAEGSISSADSEQAKKRFHWIQGIGFVIGLPICVVGFLTLLLHVGRLLGVPLLPF